MITGVSELFKFYAKKTQDGLHKVLITQLQHYYYEIIDTPQFIIAKGEDLTNIALMAHLDTVYPDETRPQMSIYRDGEIVWSPDGLGADDRAGVTMIMYLLKTTSFRPTIIFTHDEEKVFNNGAYTLATLYRYSDVYSNLKYIIELDRHGRNDCVFYECQNQKFIKHIEVFGFTTAIGIYSDISTICPIWNIAGVNLSVGYFNEHSFCEYWNIDDWENTFHKLQDILEFELTSEKKYKF